MYTGIAELEIKESEAMKPRIIISLSGFGLVDYLISRQRFSPISIFIQTEQYFCVQ
jgi:hypothetical protein